MLVATDLASRGIDVSLVSHVINFDMPNTVDAYIHRIGRTGRMENSGEAFTFMLPEDELMVRKIESVLGMRIERRRLEGFEYGSFSPHPQAQATQHQPRRKGPGGPQPRASAKRHQGQNGRAAQRSASDRPKQASQGDPARPPRGRTRNRRGPALAGGHSR